MHTFVPRFLRCFVLAAVAFLAAGSLAMAQTALPNGTTVSGRIVTPGDTALWTFSANRGDFVAISIGEVFESEVDPGFVPWIRLRGPDGRQVDTGFGVSTGSIDYAVTLTGVYEVVVADGSNSKDATGSYRLHLVKAPGEFTLAAGDEGGALTPGMNHEGEIHLGDLDAWTFTAAKGDRISLSIGEVLVGEVDPGFTPWIRLVGPTGAQLGSGFGVLTGAIDVEAPLSGNYSVIVGDGSNGRDAEGRYRLVLARVPGTFVIPAGDEGGALTNGLNHAGHIHFGDLDLWSFTGAKGDAVSLSIGEVFEGEIDPGFTPWIRLVGPNGDVLGSGFGVLTGSIDVTLPLSGEYVVIVGDGSNGRDAAGAYRLTLVRAPAAFVVPDGDEGGAMVAGVNHAGRIHLGDLDAWSFTAAKGEYIALSIGEVFEGEEDPGFTPWIRLIGPDGSRVDSGFGVLTGAANVVAPLSGVYQVIVGDGSNGRDATGLYRLTLSRMPGAFEVPAGDEGGALTNGWNHVGRIHLGDLDTYSFAAVKGDHVVVVVGEIRVGEVDPGFTPWIRVFGPAGALVDSGFGVLTGSAEFEAPLTGNYTVLVGDGSNGRDAEGTYTLCLALVPERFAVTPGDQGGPVPSSDPLVASLHVGDVDLWTFGVEAGQRIRVSVREREADGPLVPWIKVHGVDGSLTGSAFDVAEAEFEFVAAEHGLYTVVVRDGSNGRDEAGDYELTVTGLREQGGRVRIRRMDAVATRVRLTWPSALRADGFGLVSSPVAGPGDWTPVEMTVEDNGLNVWGVLPVNPGNAFLQLEKP